MWLQVLCHLTLFYFIDILTGISLQGHENATAENGPWIITLDGPSFLSIMQHARNRSLREEVYRAYVNRASSGDLDNTEIIDQILKLRMEKAKLLNYNSYAEVYTAYHSKIVLVKRMLKSILTGEHGN